MIIINYYLPLLPASPLQLAHYYSCQTPIMFTNGKMEELLLTLYTTGVSNLHLCFKTRGKQYRAEILNKVIIFLVSLTFFKSLVCK